MRNFPLRFLMLVVVTIIVTTVTACATSGSTEHGAAHSPPTTSLWKVTSPHRTLYLAGNPGGLTQADYPLPALFSKTFSQSSELILEGAKKPKHPEKIPQLIRKLGLMPSGEKLTSLLDKKQLQTLKQALSTCGLPLQRIQPMRPWLAFLVVRKICHAKVGIKSTLGVGSHFYDMATKQNMPVTPLENTAGQMKMFASFSDKLMANWLTIRAKQMAQGIAHKSDRASGLKAWQTGNTVKLVQGLTETFQGHPKLYKLLVSDRNKRWLKTLVDRLETNGKPVFVVVGLGHLIGKSNLLDLLRAHGYTITQQ